MVNIDLYKAVAAFAKCEGITDTFEMTHSDGTKSLQPLIPSNLLPAMREWLQGEIHQPVYPSTLSVSEKTGLSHDEVFADVMWVLDSVVHGTWLHEFSQCSVDAGVPTIKVCTFDEALIEVLVFAFGVKYIPALVRDDPRVVKTVDMVLDLE